MKNRRAEKSVRFAMKKPRKLVLLSALGEQLIFKTVNKDQYERRSDFSVVSSDLSLSDARDLLITRTLPLPQTAQPSN